MQSVKPDMHDGVKQTRNEIIGTLRVVPPVSKGRIAFPLRDAVSGGDVCWRHLMGGTYYAMRREASKLQSASVVHPWPAETGDMRRSNQQAASGMPSVDKRASSAGRSSMHLQDAGKCAGYRGVS